jgi:hypothetical protein
MKLHPIHKGLIISAATGFLIAVALVLAVYIQLS